MPGHSEFGFRFQGMDRNDSICWVQGAGSRIFSCVKKFALDDRPG